jgi:hypothetical protein
MLEWSPSKDLLAFTVNQRLPTWPLSFSLGYVSVSTHLKKRSKKHTLVRIKNSSDFSKEANCPVIKETICWKYGNTLPFIRLRYIHLNPMYIGSLPPAMFRSHPSRLWMARLITTTKVRLVQCSITTPRYAPPNPWQHQCQLTSLTHPKATHMEMILCAELALILRFKVPWHGVTSPEIQNSLTWTLNQLELGEVPNSLTWTY